ncbi:MAG TPA: DUF4388 domain-containing protein [Myxococcota bacterium]|nr:DUF4388 domain-containing protein [Myxococcota bacterium]
MSLALEGTLSDVGLCDLLRLIAREKRSGALCVTIDGHGYRFTLDDGRITGVRCGGGPERPAVEPTILLLVRHRRGAFRLEPPRADDPGGEGDPSAVGLHAEMLAGAGDMELVRLAERFDRAGGEDSRPMRDAFPKPRQMEALEPDVRAVFALVNGERTLGELVVRSRLDPLRVLDALVVLASESLVKRPTTGARASLQVRPFVDRAAGAWRDWLAATLPLAMLFVWLLLSGGSSGGAGSDPFAIHRDPLAAARAAHEVERLRAAVEAHRFVEGRFPERLQTLVQGGYVPASALTDARGRPYYYARRGDEFVLLSPER